MRRWSAALLVGALVVAGGVTAFAQRGFFGFGRGPAVAGNPDYDGRFTFTRVRYRGVPYGRGPNAWADGYPHAERNFGLILEALTAVPVDPEEGNVLTLEDPEIFRNPILYLWEPGFWTISDEGAANLRAFMLKGGLIIFDDFEGDLWINFEQQFRRALPDARFIPLEMSHPVYNAFFEVDADSLPHPGGGLMPTYYGVFEDNDPSGRLMAIANHNGDVSDYWEYSSGGRFPVDSTNDAYKVGVNYFVYGLIR